MVPTDDPGGEARRRRGGAAPTREPTRTTPPDRTTSPEGASIDTGDGRFSNYFQSLLDLHKELASVATQARSIEAAMQEIRSDIREIRTTVGSLPSAATVWAAVAILMTGMIGIAAVAVQVIDDPPPPAPPPAIVVPPAGAQPQ